MNQEASANRLCPNWRDPNSYKPLLKLDRAGWAWEWLRRNPDYIAQASSRIVPLEAETRLVSIPATDGVAGWGLLCRGESRPPGERCPPILEG